MTDNALITWSVLMPVKVLAQAKSRLAALAGSRRGELALALAQDTVSAALRVTRPPACSSSPMTRWPRPR